MPEKLSRAEEIELRYKQLQIEEMDERIATRRDQQARAADDRRRQYQDFLKGQAVLAHRQQVCKHRKGGRDNRFWNGNSQDYSINKNIFPTGREVIFCTRCGKQVERPARALRKTDPDLYLKMAKEWAEWSAMPTDNTPSGSKIFEVIYEEIAAA